MLINNSYSNSDFDDISRDMIDKYMTPDTGPNTEHIPPNNHINLYYRNTLVILEKG